MPANQDLLFGKITVQLGYCQQDQVDRCLEIQAASRDPLPLGRHMVDEGYLTEEQHSKVLEIQRRNMLRKDPVAGRSREDILLGKLAVREGFLTSAELNECLKRQGAAGEKRALGKIMIEAGFLTGDQVKSLLAMQSKRIMNCPRCRLSFTVMTISRSPIIDCPRCKGPLQEGKPGDSVSTDGEIATSTVRAIQDSDPVPAEPPPPAPADPAPCKICEHPFVSAPDSTGRVKCLSCQVLFTP